MARIHTIEVADSPDGAGVLFNHYLAIDKGDSVEWSWSGTLPHGISADGVPPLFQSGFQVGPQGKFRCLFDHEGSYSYRCHAQDLHAPSTPGLIVVRATPVVAANVAPPNPLPVPAPVAPIKPTPVVSPVVPVKAPTPAPVVPVKPTPLPAPAPVVTSHAAPAPFTPPVHPSDPTPFPHHPDPLDK